MTLTAGNPAKFFDATIHDEDDFAVMAKAMAGNQAAQAVVMAKPFERGPNFVLDVDCTADADDGVILSFGGGSTTVGAGFDQGVTFPANSRRAIHFRVTSRTGGSTAASTGAFYVGEYVQEVYGVESSTTSGLSHPEVQGEPRIVGGHGRTAAGVLNKYGVVGYRATLASGTIAAVDNPGGVTVDHFASGAADLTLPLVNATKTHFLGGTLSGTFSTTGGWVMLVDVAGGTDAIQLVTSGGAAGTVTPALAQPANGDIELAFELWPPTFVRLLASSTTTGAASTPGLVTLELDSNLVASATTYQAKHRVEVWIGKAQGDRP